MKKTLIVLAAVGLLASCGNSDKKPAADGTTAGETPKADLSSNPDYQKGLALISSSSNDCFGCHKIDEAFTGPAYVEVAKKYAGQGGDIVDKLAGRIIKGVNPGEGVWGDQMMTPHPNLSEADAKAMVKYVLLLNQQ